ncbi:MAG TPA: M48 family metalloprotease, partial [Actinoplanes sp.]
MRDGTRAAMSAAMFAGFLAVLWLQVGAALLVVFVVLKLMPGSVAVRVAVPLLIATGGLLWYATVRALRLRHRLPAGVPVTRQDAPALWSAIDTAAGAAGVAPPAGVTVVATATTALAELLRFGGIAGGRRDLLLGMPLLLAWDEARLRAVIAHELAHGSPRLGRLAPMAYRGRVALARIVKRIPRRSPAGPVLRAYAAWYRRVDEPFSRAQELAADCIAASLVGEHVAAAVLHDAPALDGLQRLFHAEYLGPGWQAGYAPVDVFGGFLQVLAARPEEVARLRSLDPAPPAEGDTHPAVADRIAALAQLADPTPAFATSASLEPQPTADRAEPTAEPPANAAEPTADKPPAEEKRTAAGDLVPDLPGLARALQAVAFPPGDRKVVSWDEFFGMARIAEMEREADASLRAISRAADA